MIQIGNRRRQASGRRIRMVLAVGQRLLRETLESLFSEQADMEVVAEATAPIDVMAAVSRTDADLVVLNWTEGEAIPGLCTHLFAEFPGIVVVGVAGDESGGRVCRQTVSLTRLPDASTSELLHAIRREFTRESPALN